MKRLLSLIVAIILVLSVFPVQMTFAEGTAEASADNRYYAGNSYSFRQLMLEYLGVIPKDYTALEKDAKTIVTREEFAAMMCKAFGLSVTNEKFFSDTASRETNTLAAYKYIDVPQNKTFNPAGNMMFADSVKWCMDGLGYKEYVEINGGNDAVCQMIARRVGLISASEANHPITRAEAVRLLGSALLTEQYSIKAITPENGGEVISRDTDAILLYNAHRMGVGEGIVTSNEITSIYANIDTCKKGQVRIGTIAYDYASEAAEIKELIGQNVIYFYKRNVSGMPNMIVGYVTDNDDEWSADCGSNVDTDGNALVRYDEKGKAEDKVAFSTPVLVLNGIADFSAGYSEIASLIKSDYSISNVYLNEYGNYDAVVVIKQYKNYQVQAYDKQNEKLYVKGLYNDTKHTLDLGEADLLTVLAGDEVLTTDALTPMDIVSVAVSKGGENIEVNICRTQISGAVAKTTSNKQQTVTIGEKTYVLDKSFASKYKIEAGKTYSFNIDIFGRIVFKAQSLLSGSQMYAYMYARAEKTEAFESGWRYKIFNDKGELAELNLSKKDKVTLNGVKVAAETADRTLLEKGVFKRQLVIISYDKNGKIKTLDTADGGSAESEVSLKSVGEKKRRRYVIASSTKGANAFRDGSDLLTHNLYNDTVIFMVPSTDASVEECEGFMKTAKQSGASFITNREDYVVESFRTTKEQTAFVDVCVVYSDLSAPNPWGTHYLVNDVYTTMDKDGSQQACLQALDINNGMGYDYVLEQDAYFKVGTTTDDGSTASYKRVSETEPGKTIMDMIGEGDIVQIGINANGRYDYVRLVYDYSEDKIFYGFDGNGGYAYKPQSQTYKEYSATSNANSRYAYGYVHSVFINYNLSTTERFNSDYSLCTMSSLNDITVPLETYSMQMHWTATNFFDPNNRGPKAYHGVPMDISDYMGNGKQQSETTKVIAIFNRDHSLCGCVFYLKKDI